MAPSENGPGLDPTDRAEHVQMKFGRFVALATALAFALVLATCQPEASRTLEASGVARSFEALPPGPSPSCGGLVYDRARLVEDPVNSGQLWLEIYLDTGRIDRLHPVWPQGSRLLPGPPLVVVDSAGQPIARVGDELRNVGVCHLEGSDAIVTIPAS